ncbi:4-hydroxy-tetrahydrodipicolinate synthase [Halobacillus kuroshimensis]|uniref:4-hydroxy-tetrahydrodipicolinate synthase n=1 Tax=Halobacillus kuroshimensis TaxID=302481 RepID=A0ABS3DTF5_9BACI|nr:MULTISPECIES: 4-hydroxy-tetrahydrodipicolinate synthase [Halobacillus]MBN8234503.1 4-hydroxy-tetrahydrodipicolinate synthase [Halobacillus kuroshimensis]
MSFGKVLTAMVTPFDEQNRVDFHQTSILIEHLISSGSDGLVVTGTTGESPTLTRSEKISLWKHVVQVVHKRIPVIAGTGSNNTMDTIEMSRQAEAAGVDAVMLVAPYYNKPDQEGLYRHFKAAAESVSLPVMVYNVPGRSVTKIDPDTVVRLSKISNITSVKEASGDLNAIASIVSRTAPGFDVYSGDDHLTLPAYVIGAAGIISVASHVIGDEMQRMLRLFDLGRGRKAGALHRELLPIFEGMFSAPSPAPVKAALRCIGIETGGVRLPLRALTDEEEKGIQTLLDHSSLQS